MELRMSASCGVSRAVAIALTALATIATTQRAEAAPPSITGAPITVLIPPAPGVAFTINLRERGAIAGSAPLIIQPASLQILVNGNVTATLQAALFANNGPGRTCVTIRNADHTPTPSNVYQLRFQVGGLPGASTTPVQNAPIINAPGNIVDTPAEEAACNDPNTPPVANAGPDRTIADTNGQPGEPVALQGSATDADGGTVLAYAWFNAAGQQIGTGPTPTVTLADGVHTLTLRATDDSFDPQTSTDTDTVTITVSAPVANQPPTANAGPDRTIADTNGAPGEVVALNGGQSTDPDGQIATYQWFRVVDGVSVPLGTGVTLNATLPDGANNIRLIVTDDDEDSDDDTVTITVTPPAGNGSPTANAGPDRTINDTNNSPGEPVTLDGTLSSDPDGPLARYQWFRVSDEADTLLGAGATLTTTLPDGVNDVRLVVTDSAGATASDLVQIIVNALNSTPTVNAGVDQIAPDTDRNPGELVSLTGAATDTDGSIASYQWFLGETPLGTGASLQTRLPNGVNIVTLAATDDTGNVGRDTVQVTVGVPATRGALADLPNLDPNLRKTAQALDRICTQLDSLDDVATNALSADQRDLRDRCDAIYFDPSENASANQVDALDALVGKDFAVARTQTLLFANTQYASIMDRLIALRGGARGLSLAGLSIMVDGKMLPLAELRDMVQGMLGGGAASDADLLSDKWGMWARGNYSFGDKSDDRLSPSFDADQWALVGGVDYRLSDQAVIGAALSYGDSTIDFAAREGGLDTASWAVSLYGSMYAAKNFYFDAILNVANSSYEARRNIVYNNGVGLVDLDAGGDTDGMVLSGGASAGYDFLLGRLTVSPNLGFFYIDANIDGFTESGAGGLNLIYDEQNFKSLTGNLGVRLTYPWNLPWGVLMPHLRVDYVREFEDDVDVFGVRFAADPNAASAPPILIETDNPDQSYFRIAAGFSAQFPYGFSGYVEYQRLESFQSISFQDVSVGLRMQRSF
jgi:outer membrane autotransporter protein